MANVFPFNYIAVNGAKVVGPEDFIYGSGTLNLTGEDSSNTTADGLIHHYRSALTPSATAELRGNKVSVDTGHPGDDQPWPVLSGSLTVGLVEARGDEPIVLKTFEGIIGGEYDSDTNRTSINITGNEPV